MRVLGGESAEEVAEALGVSVVEVERWRREFVVAGERRMGELPLGALERVFSPFERLVPLCTLISVTIAVALFVQGQAKERDANAREAARAREMRVTEAFNALDDKYIDYVKLCLAHPELDTFDTPLARTRPATAAELRGESMMFAILLSVMERSYLMYRDPSDAFKREQWVGWEAYVRSWLGRENFLAEWGRTKREFDPAFVMFLDKMIAAGKTKG
ncbi:MAG: hypothetical protein JWN40_4632 [Phycisphaerales bacterium]|nr:hypothetical protein [Phycisphaerales bacterium]